MLKHFATPSDLLKLQKKILPWTGLFFFIFLILGLWFSLIQSPPDYQQGESVRIMYVHVPASWMALGVYCFMGGSAALGFITKHPLADLMTKAAAPLGMCFTFISLVTGSLWGKPMWGVWWVWDARLTSMLILFFLYLGYLILVDSHEESAMGLKMGSVLILIGIVNIPIIKWSVNWWTTLHQPASVIREGGSAIHSSMLTPLLLMMGAYILLFIHVFCWQLETEILKRKIQAEKRKA